MNIHNIKLYFIGCATVKILKITSIKLLKLTKVPPISSNYFNITVILNSYKTTVLRNAQSPKISFIGKVMEILK